MVVDTIISVNRIHPSLKSVFIMGVHADCMWCDTVYGCACV